MSLGTKNRRKQTAEHCREHLRQRFAADRALVEEFIIEFEGREADDSVWGQFTDDKRDTVEMLKRLEQKFLDWLNPPG